MLIISAVRAVLSDGPFYECPQLWVTPDFIECTEGWSWQLDMPNPLEDDTPWRMGLDAFLGHYFVYKVGPIKVGMWRIVKVDESRNMLLGKWPD